MGNSPFSQVSFRLAMAALQCARSESQGAAALVSAATSIQHAACFGGDDLGMLKILNEVGFEFPQFIRAVLERAANVHDLGAEGKLAFSLIPIILNNEKSLPGRIDLTKQQTRKMQLEGVLLDSLNIQARKTESGELSRSGWSFVVPALYSEQVMQSTALPELIRLARNVRKLVRGEAKTFRFTHAKSEKAPGGAQIYYMPVISYIPVDRDLMPAKPNDRVTALLSQWVGESVKQLKVATNTSVVIGNKPVLCSMAFEIAQRIKLGVSLQEMVERVCELTDMAPQALGATVALYHPANGYGMFVGVTMVSRLLNQTLATVHYNVHSLDGIEETAQVVSQLKELGIGATQTQLSPVATIICQHCGSPQYITPDPAVMTEGIVTLPGVAGQAIH